MALQPFVDLAWDHPSLLKGATSQVLQFLPILLSPPEYKEHSWSNYNPHPEDIPEGEDWLEYANPAQEILLAFANAYPSILRDWDGGRLVQSMVPILLGRLVAELIWEEDENGDWLKVEDVSWRFRFFGTSKRRS